MARWRATEPEQTGRPKVPATALVLGGVFGLEGGAAIAATIIPTAGIAGTVMLRLGLGSAGLLGLGRPSLRRQRTARAWIAHAPCTTDRRILVEW